MAPIKVEIYDHTDTFTKIGGIKVGTDKIIICTENEKGNLGIIAHRNDPSNPSHRRYHLEDTFPISEKPTTKNIECQINNHKENIKATFSTT